MFLQDGDIHRHMYLQDLYISEAEDKPTLRYANKTKVSFGKNVSLCVTDCG